MKRFSLWKFFLKAAAAAVIFGLIPGCVSGPPDIPDGLSSAELVQRGQEASDRNRYNQALSYYMAIVERYPLDIDAVCTAEYEIAFIHYKQKKYDEALLEFDALLARYVEPGGETLPPQFKRLAEIGRDKILEKSSAPSAGF